MLASRSSAEHRSSHENRQFGDMLLIGSIAQLKHHDANLGDAAIGNS